MFRAILALSLLLPLCSGCAATMKVLSFLFSDSETSSEREQREAEAKEFEEDRQFVEEHRSNIWP